MPPKTKTKVKRGRPLDPVNDPAYNMRNIVKQSILLEEHLAEDRKYCMMCIVKHFLHIIGLAEEAVWLAGADRDKYPHLAGAPDFYQKLLDAWEKQRVNQAVRVRTLAALRQQRRTLLEAYYLGG